MTTIAHKNVDTESMVIREAELTSRPLDCTFYKADLLTGFTLLGEPNIYGGSADVTVSPLHRDGRAILIPKSVFEGEILRAGWVTKGGGTIFHWYLLTRDTKGNYVALEVREYIQQKRCAVTIQTVMVPELG